MKDNATGIVEIVGKVEPNGNVTGHSIVFLNGNTEFGIVKIIKNSIVELHIFIPNKLVIDLHDKWNETNLKSFVSFNIDIIDLTVYNEAISVAAKYPTLF